MAIYISWNDGCILLKEPVFIPPWILNRSRCAIIETELKLTGMKNLEELKKVLATEKRSICERYRITKLGIFGSYARGEQTEVSDLDILVDYEIAPTFIDLVELRDYLSEVFDLPVDVVTKNGLKKRIRDRVLTEVIDI